MRAFPLNPEEPISIMGFLAVLKLDCDSNKIHEGAVVWVLPHYVQAGLANALNSRVCTKF